MRSYKMRVDFESRPIIKVKAKSIKDLENSLKGLKIKFGEGE